jgi:hypothetical protein
LGLLQFSVRVVIQQLTTGVSSSSSTTTQARYH